MTGFLFCLYLIAFQGKWSIRNDQMHLAHHFFERAYDPTKGLSRAMDLRTDQVLKALESELAYPLLQERSWIPWLPPRDDVLRFRSTRFINYHGVYNLFSKGCLSSFYTQKMFHRECFTVLRRCEERQKVESQSGGPFQGGGSGAKCCCTGTSTISPLQLLRLEAMLHSTYNVLVGVLCVCVWELVRARVRAGQAHPDRRAPALPQHRPDQADLARAGHLGAGSTPRPPVPIYDAVSLRSRCGHAEVTMRSRCGHAAVSVAIR